MINLEHLVLNNNKLRNIDDTFIVNLNKLDHFDISHNELTQLPTKWLPDCLNELFINGNAIEMLSMNTFEGALQLYVIGLPLNNITIEYDTFIMLTKLRSFEVDDYVDNSECTCKYIWYLNTKINSTVCDNSNNKYASIREYLKGKCELPG